MPFLAEKLQVSEQEAARILTNTRDKGPRSAWIDIYKAGLRATYGDDDEARTIANDTIKLLFPDAPAFEKPPPPPKEDLKGGKLREWLDNLAPEV